MVDGEGRKGRGEGKAMPPQIPTQSHYLCPILSEFNIAYLMLPTGMRVN